MRLGGDEEGVRGDLDHLHQLVVGRRPADDESRLLEGLAIGVVELVAVAVALQHHVLAVEPPRERPGLQRAFLGTEPHRPALALHVALGLLEVDHRVRGVLVELGGIGPGQPQHIPGELDGRDLHAQAEAQVRDARFAGVSGGADLALDPAVAETAGHEDATEILELLGRVVALEFLGLDLDDLHARVGGDARVLERLVDRLVGVLQFDVLAHHPDAHAMLGCDEPADDVLPVGHVRRRQVQLEGLADQVVHVLALQHERHLVDGVVDVLLLDHRVEGHVAEHRQLAADLLAEGLLAAGHQHVRGDADLAQLGHALLRRLGLQLAGGLDEGHVGDVDEADVAGARLLRELADGLEERQTFDVTDRAADLGDEHVGPRLGGQVGDPPLDLVGHVGDHLDRLAQVHPVALVLEHLLVHLTAGGRVGTAELGVGEALVVSEVEIRLGAVVQHVHLAVLVRAHGAGVDVQVGVELLQRDGEAAVLQQGSERRRGEPLAEGAHDTARDEDVLHGMVRSQGVDPCIKENFPRSPAVRAGLIRGRSISRPRCGGGSGRRRTRASG